MKLSQRKLSKQTPDNSSATSTHLEPKPEDKFGIFDNEKKSYLNLRNDSDSDKLGNNASPDSIKSPDNVILNKIASSAKS